MNITSHNLQMKKYFRISITRKMPDLNVNQTELQFEITKGLSSFMASLIVSEGILHAKQQKKNLYLATLGGQKAFDLVHRMILLNKSFFMKYQQMSGKVFNSAL